MLHFLSGYCIIPGIYENLRLQHSKMWKRNVWREGILSQVYLCGGILVPGAPCWKSFLWVIRVTQRPVKLRGSGCLEPARCCYCCCTCSLCCERDGSSKLSNLYSNRLMQSFWLETDQNSPDWARLPSSGTQLQQPRPLQGNQTWRLPLDQISCVIWFLFRLIIQSFCFSASVFQVNP